MTEANVFEAIELSVGQALLKRLAGSLAQVEIWNASKSVRLSGKLSGFQLDAALLKVAFPPNISGRKRIEIAEALRENPGAIFCAYSNRGNLFFEANYHSTEGHSLRFHNPQKFHRVQRRKHLRLSIHEDVRVRFRLSPEAPIQEKQVLDLSAGGMGIAIRASEQNQFSEGGGIYELSFRIRDRDLQLSGKIQHIRELPPSLRRTGLRVGIQFTDISEAEEQVIMSYVVDKEFVFGGS